MFTRQDITTTVQNEAPEEEAVVDRWEDQTATEEKNCNDTQRNPPGKLPAGLALGRETVGTSLLEECLELSQQRIRRAKESVYFCHKQEDVQKLSSLDQQTCLCKGKFDTEYVLFTPHAMPVK